MIRELWIMGSLLCIALFCGCVQPAVPPVQQSDILVSTTGISASDNGEPDRTFKVPETTGPAEKTTADPSTTTVPVTTPAPAPTPRLGIVAPAEPDPVDITAISFARYSDSDFVLEYPSTWNITTTTYTPYPCITDSTMRCHQNETEKIGPFNFNDISIFKKPIRIVTFTSGDKKQKLVVFTADFLDNVNGNYELNPTLDWARERVEMIFPDITGSVVGDFQYYRIGPNMASEYTVTMPERAAAYPLAYTMKNIVTNHHVYEFAFISDTTNIQKYYNLKNRMLTSITTQD